MCGTAVIQLHFKTINKKQFSDQDQEPSLRLRAVASVRKTLIQSIMRYPGGKSKLAGKIVGIIRDWLEYAEGTPEYREPFFGGELRPGGMAHDQNAIRITPVLGD